MYTYQIQLNCYFQMITKCLMKARILDSYSLLVITFCGKLGCESHGPLPVAKCFYVCYKYILTGKGTPTHFLSLLALTHWCRVTHICVGNLTIIGSDNGLSPGRHQAITWTNVGILLIGPLGTNFSEMLIEIHTFSFQKIHLKMLAGKPRPFWPGLNVLKHG